VEARLGSLVFALPFLPDVMTDKTDKVLAGRGYYWAIGSSYVNALGKGIVGFESVSREVENWATGKQPFSDDPLLFLFATMKDASGYQQKAQ
jgi:hypothetical protein